MATLNFEVELTFFGVTESMTFDTLAEIIKVRPNLDHEDFVARVCALQVGESLDYIDMKIKRLS